MIDQSIAKLIETLHYPPHCSSWITQRCATLPSGTPQYIEYRLCDNSQLDFLYCIDFNYPLSDFALEPKIQQRIAKIAEVYPNSPYYWIEYDHINQENAAPAPSLHVCTAKQYLSNEQTYDVIETPQIMQVLSLLSGSHLNDDSLHQFINVVAQYGAIIHVSCMYGRKPASLKFFVKVHHSKITALMAAVNWGGDMTALQNLLSYRWVQPNEQGEVCIDFKYEGTLSPYIGIVYSRLKLTPDGGARLAALIEKDIIADDDQIKATMEWLGLMNEAHCTKWVDLKTLIAEDGSESTKLYYGFQDTKAWYEQKLLANSDKVSPVW